MICSTDPSKFESSKLLETVVSLLKKRGFTMLASSCFVASFKGAVSPRFSAT